MTRAEQVWAVVLIGVGVALCFVPLFDLLAFEFSFALGIPVTFCAGWLGVRAGREVEEAPGAWWAAVRTGLALAALPLLPITLNALRIRNCDYVEGLLLYLLLPGVTVLVGAGWGVACGRAAPRFGTRLYVALVLTSVAWAVGRFWLHPPVDAFNPFLAYWPGALYDEVISVDDRLLVSRAEDLAVAVAAVSLVARPRWLAAVALPIAAFAWFATGRMDVRRDAAYVQAALGGRAETAARTPAGLPAIVLYHPGDWPDDEVRRALTELSFARSELEAFFGFAPERSIEVYAYASAGQKKRLMGARRVQIAKPWQYAFHVQGVGGRVTVHEMAHVFSADVAAPPFHLPMHRGVLPNMGLIEGLAVAAAWDDSRLDVHQWSLAMEKAGVSIPIERLLEPAGFLGANSGAAYTRCGSFTRYYREREGADALAAAYRAGRFPELARHADAWRTWLRSEPLPEEAVPIAEARFERPAIFQRVCAHEMAAITAAAGAAAARGKLDEAIRRLDAVLAHVPGDVYVQLSKARLLLRLGRDGEAWRIATDVAALESAGRVARDRAREILGDIAALEADPYTADPHYGEARRNAYGRDDIRRLEAKREALARGEAGLEVLELLVRHPANVDSKLRRIGAEPDWALGTYLVGRHQLREEQFEEADGTLTRALQQGLADPSVRLEAERLRAVALLRLGRYPAAARRFDELAARDDLELQRGERATLKVAARRARFFAAHPPETIRGPATPAGSPAG